MPEKSTGGGSFPEDRNTDAEAAYGGADSVEKTTYVTGSGTDPNARKGSDGPAAQVPAGGGQGATWAIIVFLVVAAVLVYLLGFGR